MFLLDFKQNLQFSCLKIQHQQLRNTFCMNISLTRTHEICSIQALSATLLQTFTRSRSQRSTVLYARKHVHVPCHGELSVAANVSNRTGAAQEPLSCNKLSSGDQSIIAKRSHPWAHPCVCVCGWMPVQAIASSLSNMHAIIIIIARSPCTKCLICCLRRLKELVVFGRLRLCVQ